MPHASSPRARLVHIALVVVALLPLRPLAAQSTLQQQLDVARLEARRDSFVVMLRGAPRGWQVLSAAPDSGGWMVGDAISIEGMVSQASRVRLDGTLHERSLRQEGTMAGKPMRIALDRKGARVTGTALTPSHPAGELAIDVAHTDGLFDDNAITPLLGAVRWREGLVLGVPVLASGKGTISNATLTVQGRETVTVPAGQFDAWRVEFSLDGGRMVAWVSAAAPYRVVRMQLGPAFEVQLVH